MKNLMILLLGLLVLPACIKRKLSGSISISGIVNDVHSKLPVANAKVCLGKYSSNWTGARFDILQIALTDMNGNYHFSDSLFSSGAIFVAIVDSQAAISHIGSMNDVYHFEKINFDTNDEWVVFDHEFAIASSQKINFGLKRLSKLKVDLKENVFNVQDSVTFTGPDFKVVKVTNDTTVFLKLKPDFQNHVQLKSNGVELFNEMFQTTFAGDTVVRQINL